MSGVFAFCLHSLRGQMFPWIFIPSGIFPCFASNKSFIPSNNCKKKKSHAAFGDYCFVILMLLLFPPVCEKEQHTSLVLLTRTVISNSKTQWKLQDMQKKIALYSYKKKKKKLWMNLKTTSKHLCPFYSLFYKHIFLLKQDLEVSLKISYSSTVSLWLFFRAREWILHGS